MRGVIALHSSGTSNVIQSTGVESEPELEPEAEPTQIGYASELNLCFNKEEIKKI